MLKISQQQAQTRWDTLPDNLKEAIFDEDNADIVWKLGEKNHLSEDKIRQIATVAGDVLMGFMHPDIDEVAAEIQERIAAPKEVSLDIAKELERKIFSNYKDDLGKIYAPPRKEHEPAPVTIETRPPPEPIEKEPPKEILKPVEAPDNIPFAETKKEQKEELPVSARLEPVEGGKAEPPAISGDEGEDEPFILHEEKPAVAPSRPPERPSVSFETMRDIKKPPAKKPAKAKVSLPFSEEPEIRRVVHYSDFRTPLDTNE